MNITLGDKTQHLLALEAIHAALDCEGHFNPMSEELLQSIDTSDPDFWRGRPLMIICPDCIRRLRTVLGITDETVPLFAPADLDVLKVQLTEPNPVDTIVALQAEIIRQADFIDLLSRGKSPCGHWSAYALTDDGGKTITCTQCRAEAAEATIAEVIDVLAKHCRGSNYAQTTTENVAEIVDKVCAIGLQDALKVQDAATHQKELAAMWRGIADAYLIDKGPGYKEEAAAMRRCADDLDPAQDPPMVDRPNVARAREIVDTYAPGELGLVNLLVMEFDARDAAAVRAVAQGGVRKSCPTCGPPGSRVPTSVCPTCGGSATVPA